MKKQNADLCYSCEHKLTSDDVLDSSGIGNDQYMCDKCWSEYGPIRTVNDKYEVRQKVWGAIAAVLVGILIGLVI